MRSPRVCRNARRRFVNILLQTFSHRGLACPGRRGYCPAMPVSTAWTRNPKSRTAFRGCGVDALTLVRDETGWAAFQSGSLLFRVDTEAPDDLESVIVQVDLLSPPTGWTVETPDTWTRGPWICQRGEVGWSVSSPSVKVRQPFSSCDRARKWVDLRTDRTGGLRGPRSRRDTRSDRTLPDVRVTSEEREAALLLARRLGMSYAALTRAALVFVEKLEESGELQVCTRGPDEKWLRHIVCVRPERADTHVRPERAHARA